MDQDVKTISDLVDKVRHLVPELRDVEDIEVYQDEYLLALGEEVGVINTQDVVVIIPKTRDVAPEEKLFIIYRGVLQKMIPYLLPSRS